MDDLPTSETKQLIVTGNCRAGQSLSSRNKTEPPRVELARQPTTTRIRGTIVTIATAAAARHPPVRWPGLRPALIVRRFIQLNPLSDHRPGPACLSPRLGGITFPPHRPTSERSLGLDRSNASRQTAPSATLPARPRRIFVTSTDAERIAIGLLPLAPRSLLVPTPAKIHHT